MEIETSFAGFNKIGATKAGEIMGENAGCAMCDMLSGSSAFSSGTGKKSILEPQPTTGDIKHIHGYCMGPEEGFLPVLTEEFRDLDTIHSEVFNEPLVCSGELGTDQVPILVEKIGGRISAKALDSTMQKALSNMWSQSANDLCSGLSPRAETVKGKAPTLRPLVWPVSNDLSIESEGSLFEKQDYPSSPFSLQNFLENMEKK